MKREDDENVEPNEKQPLLELSKIQHVDETNKKSEGRLQHLVYKR